MSQVAMMAASLLCHITFAPEGGHDPEETADLVNSWWQTILHEISDADREQILGAMEQLASDLASREPQLREHELASLQSIRSLLRGEMS